MKREVDPSVKIVGHRAPPRGGVAAAAPFLDLVIRLRGDKPFIPKGVYRFRSFEEGQDWSLAMMTRRRKQDRSD